MPRRFCPAVDAERNSGRLARFRHVCCARRIECGRAATISHVLSPSVIHASAGAEQNKSGRPACPNSADKSG